MLIIAATGAGIWYGWPLWENYRGEQQVKQDNQDQAEELAKVETGEDDITQALDYSTAGSLYADQGEYQKALEALMKAQEICDRTKDVSVACNPGYQELIGDMHQQLGNDEQAQAAWQKAIADYKRLRTAELTYEEDIKRVEAK